MLIVVAIRFGITVKKTGLRVKWADHFGGKIALSDTMEGEEVEGTMPAIKSSSFSESKTRDRMREKELLAKAK
jgi:hypothetical protein